MPYTIRLEKFEGPLDLLLQLIESQELDITEISLAQVAEQYIEYLASQAERIDPEELADFLVVAAKLLLIKSRVLLPSLHFEEEEGVRDLEHQLKIYKEYLEASRVIHKIILKKNFSFTRERMAILEKKAFYPPPGLDPKKLKKAFIEILQEIEQVVRLPQESIKKVISIQEKIQEIRKMIFKKVSIGFRDLLQKTKSKTEAVVTFLALLELVKQRLVIVTQEGTLEEIIIKKIYVNKSD